MNRLNKTLLGGVALVTLTASSSSAIDAGRMHFTMLNGGRIINKTKQPHVRGATHSTYSFSVTTHINSRTQHKEIVKLGATVTNVDCNVIKFKIPRKTQFAKLGEFVSTETSSSCGNQPSKWYGTTYELTDKSAKGQTDHFVETLVGKEKFGETKFIDTIHMTVNVIID